MYRNKISLHDTSGERKYLNQKERQRFLDAALKQPNPLRLYCLLLWYTGARIGEVHNLTPMNIDYSSETVVIQSLKKRQAGIFREIPVPEFLLQNLDSYVTTEQIKSECSLWHFSIRTASRKIKKVMNQAEIYGSRSTAKALRHGFAVHAVTRVPLPLVKKWLGHENLETTEIYLNIVGPEERELAKSIW